MKRSRLIRALPAGSFTATPPDRQTDFPSAAGGGGRPKREKGELKFEKVATAIARRIVRAQGLRPKLKKVS